MESLKQWVSLPEEAKIISTLVSPVKKAKDGAVPHLKSFSFWPLDNFTTWATNALAVIRELRTKFSVSGDLLWRAEAYTAFENARLDANSLYKFLSENTADKILHSDLEDW
jgi:hypothetical protein